MSRSSGLSLSFALGSFVLLSACADPVSSTAGGAPIFSAVASDEPSLLVCPTEQPKSVTLTVGAEGGRLSVAGSSVVIPAGAVAGPTEFTLEMPASPYLEVDIRATGHDAFRFQRAVRVTIGYAHCGRSANDLSPLSAWYISESDDLLENMGGVDDKRAKKVTFATDHLSGYALAE